MEDFRFTPLPPQRIRRWAVLCLTGEGFSFYLFLVHSNGQFSITGNWFRAMEGFHDLRTRFGRSMLVTNVGFRCCGNHWQNIPQFLEEERCH